MNPRAPRPAISIPHDIEMADPRLVAAIAPWWRALEAALCSTQGGAAEVLAGICGPTLGLLWADRLSAANGGGERRTWREGTSLDAALGREARRAHGIYFTPPWLAREMAGMLPEGLSGPVVDLAAGAGELLLAAVERHPELWACGVEWRPELAVAAALRLCLLRVEQGRDPRATGDQIACADGLGEPRTLAAHWGLSWPAAAVVGNPPYVGEKGRRGFFADLRARHPDLAHVLGPRADLSYLFLRRALDWAAPGAPMVHLTSAYWLEASGAGRLRAALADGADPTWMARLNFSGVFSDAPGHHSLLSAFVRKPHENPTLKAHVVEATRPEALVQALSTGAAATGAKAWAPSGGTASWHPFATGPAHLPEHCPTLLGALARDCQGVVSGADRLSAEACAWIAQQPGAQRRALGSPVFLFRADELALANAAGLGPLMRPVLRGSELQANQVVAPGHPFAHAMLYVDGPLEGELLEAVSAHLGPVRPWLERRREVQLGRMPWYRLHWPRRLADMVGPKLVVPRRAPRPCFALDLSGAVISSDCTYLVAPPHARDPVEWLCRLMRVLNDGATCDWLRAYGKSKGGLMEFYAEPLRRLPLPLVADGEGGIVGVGEG